MSPMRPRLTIDVSAIEHNTRLVARLLGPCRIRLTGVTKACLGDPHVAAAMLAGGAASLADSRSANIARLRRHHPDCDLQLLRPSLDPEEGFDADLCFVSSAGQARTLLERCGPGRLRFLLMVETGDGREGVPLELAGEQARRLAAMPGADLAGVATNIACSRPEAPLAAALTALEEAAAEISGVVAGGRPWRSAGGSGLLRLLAGSRTEAGGPLAALDELRCGEALLLGSIPGGAPTEPVGAAADGGPPADGGVLDPPGTAFLEGARTDAFLLEADVLEVYEKGGACQALLAVGSQDIGSEAASLRPLRDDVMPLNLTSDYLAVSLEADHDAACADSVPAAGGRLRFIPGYYALVAAMTSPFVEKVFI